MENLEELKKMREKIKKELDLRNGKHRIKIVVCLGTCGIAAGAREAMNTFVELIASNNKTDIKVATSGCAGFCAQEPIIYIYVEDRAPVVYRNVNVEAAKEIFASHILNDKIVEKYLFSKGKK